MSDEQSAQIKAHLAAPPQRVWHALTDAEALAAWYWPATLKPEVVSEPRAGGRFSLTARAAEMGVSGVYQEFDPPRRMVQSWSLAGVDRDSRVIIVLTPADGGTDLVISHDAVDEATAQMYRLGWESSLGRLPGYLA